MSGYQISIELTNHCNFKCVMCPHAKWREADQANPFDRDKGFMSEELFELAAENARRYASKVSLGFFGEQMLHPKFGEYVQRLRSDAYELVLFSNWSLFTREHVQALRACDRIQISLDSVDGPTWKSLCPGGPVLDLDGKPGGDRYETLVDKISYWLSLSDRPSTGLECVISSVNQADRHRIPRQWRRHLGPNDHIATKSVLSYGGVMSDAAMKPNPCKVPDQGRITIGWDGRCSPCNLDVNLAMTAANLLEQRDLQTIVQSPAWQQQLQRIRDRQGICANCFDANNHSQEITQPKACGRWLSQWLRRAG